MTWVHPLGVSWKTASVSGCTPPCAIVLNTYAPEISANVVASILSRIAFRSNDWHRAAALTMIRSASAPYVDRPSNSTSRLRVPQEEVALRQAGRRRGRFGRAGQDLRADHVDAAEVLGFDRGQRVRGGGTGVEVDVAAVTGVVERPGGGAGGRRDRPDHDRVRICGNDRPGPGRRSRCRSAWWRRSGFRPPSPAGCATAATWSWRRCRRCRADRPTP